MNNIYAVFKRARFSLHILVLVLFVVGLYLLSLFHQSCTRLDAVAKQSSQTIFTNVLQREQSRLAQLAYLYASSLNTLEKLQGKVGLEKNWAGPDIVNAVGLSHIAVLNAQQQLVQGQSVSQSRAWLEQPDIKKLLQQAANSTQAVTGFAKIGNEIELVTATILTSGQTTQKLSSEHNVGMLVMTKSLVPMLAMWGKRFQFDSIRLLPPNKDPAPSMVSLNITSASDQLLAQAAWQPKTPGSRLWHKSVPGLIVVLAIFALMLTLFWRQINRYFHFSLRSADELARTHQQLNELAYFDATTKLPNRSLGLDRLNQALKSGKRSGLMTAVVFIDLDGFKAINDRYGHIVGDQVLQQVGQNITGCIRQEDTLARFGGDEFIVILAGLQQAQDADVVVHKIWQVFNEIFYVGDNMTQLTASIGVAVSPRDGCEAEELIHKADHAMYHTKHSGKNNYGYYVGEITA